MSYNKSIIITLGYELLNIEFEYYNLYIIQRLEIFLSCFIKLVMHKLGEVLVVNILIFIIGNKLCKLHIELHSIINKNT